MSTTIKRAHGLKGAVPPPRKKARVSLPPPPPPLPPVASSSSSSPSISGDDSNDDDVDDDETDAEEQQAARLRALEAYGRAMFGDVLPSPAVAASSASFKGKGKARAADVDLEGLEGLMSGDEEDEGDYSEEEGSMADDDEDLIAVAKEPSKIVPTGSKLPEVVYAPQKFVSSQSSKADYKAFMSSKASKVLSNPSLVPPTKTPPTTAEAALEKSHLSLDKTLHSLLVTSLLAPGAASSPRALQGRLNELAGGARLGDGEREVKRGEMGRLGGANSVGRGLRKVGKQRWEKGLSDAHERGDHGLLNAHTSSSIFASPSPSAADAASKPRKGADRGLSMGVGRFQQGVLKLSQEDMDGVKRESERRARGRESGRGRGGGRGGRGGRGGGGGGGRGGRGRGGKR